MQAFVASALSDHIDINCSTEEADLSKVIAIVQQPTQAERNLRQNLLTARETGDIVCNGIGTFEALIFDPGDLCRVISEAVDAVLNWSQQFKDRLQLVADQPAHCQSPMDRAKRLAAEANTQTLVAALR